MKLVGHIVNLQKRVSILEEASLPYEQAGATSGTSAMDGDVPTITAQEAVLAAETMMKLQQTDMNAETIRMEAEARTEAHTLTQAHFKAKADARDQSQTFTTAAKWRKE